MLVNTFKLGRNSVYNVTITGAEQRRHGGDPAPGGRGPEHHEGQRGQGPGEGREVVAAGGEGGQAPGGHGPVPQVGRPHEEEAVLGEHEDEDRHRGRHRRHRHRCHRMDRLLGLNIKRFFVVVIYCIIFNAFRISEATLEIVLIHSIGIFKL